MRPGFGISSMASISAPAKVTANNGAVHANEMFGRFARVAAHAAGKPVVFLIAVAVVVVWAATGPIFKYSDTWQLVINTGTTIVTFLMVFLIQNTQNRDTMAVQLKLAEIILAMRGAENRLAMAEEMTDEELEALHEECRRRADQALEVLETVSARRAAKTGKHKKQAGTDTFSKPAKNGSPAKAHPDKQTK